MVIYGLLLVITALIHGVTGNAQLAFTVFVALFILKLLVLGPEPDENG